MVVPSMVSEFPVLKFRTLVLPSVRLLMVSLTFSCTTAAGLELLITALLLEVGALPRDQLVEFQLPAPPFQSSSVIAGRTNGCTPKACVTEPRPNISRRMAFCPNSFAGLGRTLCAQTNGAHAAKQIAAAASGRTETDLVDIWNPPRCDGYRSHPINTAQTLRKARQKIAPVSEINLVAFSPGLAPYLDEGPSLSTKVLNRVVLGATADCRGGFYDEEWRNLFKGRLTNSWRAGSRENPARSMRWLRWSTTSFGP